MDSHAVDVPLGLVAVTAEMAEDYSKPEDELALYLVACLLAGGIEPVDCAVDIPELGAWVAENRGLIVPHARLRRHDHAWGHLAYDAIARCWFSSPRDAVHCKLRWL